jgi:hypothetical protein
MTWRRPHWRERPNHPEDELRLHEAMRVPTLIINTCSRHFESVDAAEIRRD